MRAIPIIMGILGVLVIGLMGFLAYTFWPESDGQSPQMTLDSGARIEIEMLSQQIEGLQEQILGLESDIQNLANTQRATAAQMASSAQSSSASLHGPLDEGETDTGPNDILDSYAQVVLIPNRRQVNKGISVGSPKWLEGFLGRPREVLSDNCQAMTNPRLKKNLILADVGPIRVRMLKPAADSITRIFEKVKSVDPDLYARIRSSGSLCVRQIRGSRGRTSTHSFGLAVDLNIDGRLDNFADGKTQLGLTILADFFIAEGWVWGAGFSREDSMHFEVSKQRLMQWRENGTI